MWGQGHVRDALQKRITRTKAPVSLRGYSDHAAREFENASFSLLTSDNEAFGLVIVESMGHGCLPISYDLAYGPGEIITDGVDGFLVPANDVEALAEAIRRVTRMSEQELRPLREAAHRRALDFTDEHVTARWIDVMTTVGAAKTTS